MKPILNFPGYYYDLLSCNVYSELQKKTTSLPLTWYCQKNSKRVSLYKDKKVFYIFQKQIILDLEKQVFYIKKTKDFKSSNCIEEQNQDQRQEMIKFFYERKNKPLRKDGFIKKFNLSKILKNQDLFKIINNYYLLKPCFYV